MNSSTATHSFIHGVAVLTMPYILNADRKVTIAIKNSSSRFTLQHPRTYTYSGYLDCPPQLTIRKNGKAECSFTKTALSACGAVGVLTYKILNDEQKCDGELGIMFSVPYSYRFYENWFSLGIFDPEIQCDWDLYNKMYYEEGTFSRANCIGNSITYSGKSAVVEGTMSPQGQSVINVELHDEHQEQKNQ